MLTFDGIRNNSFFGVVFQKRKSFKYRNFDKDEIFSYLNTLILPEEISERKILLESIGLLEAGSKLMIFEMREADAFHFSGCIASFNDGGIL